MLRLNLLKQISINEIKDNIILVNGKNSKILLENSREPILKLTYNFLCETNIFHKNHIQKYTPLICKQITDSIYNNRGIIAFDINKMKIVGFLTFTHIMKSENIYSKNIKYPAKELCRGFINEKYRKKGIYLIIRNKVIEIASSTPGDIVTLTNKNYIIKLCEKEKWIKYNDTEAALLYGLDINNIKYWSYLQKSETIGYSLFVKKQ